MANIVFAPHNAYHTFNMSFIVPYLEEKGHNCTFVNIDKLYGEGAETEINRLKLKKYDYSKNIFNELNPDVIVCMNDWGGIVKSIINKANSLGIPTIGMVEGVQDFEDTHVKHIGVGKIRHPYKRVKYVFLTGEYDKKFFNPNRSYLVGVPRIEPLFNEPVQFPEKDLVSINCNFTYGLYTKIAMEWVNDVVSACKELNLDYVVTQHHSDKNDLKNYNVSKLDIHDVLRKSTVHISRFSTCILESMALGTPVVYHNPHEERVGTFQDPMGAYRITKNKNDLIEAIKVAVSLKSDYKDICKKKLNHHIALAPKSSSERAAEGILDVIHKDNRKYLNVFEKITLKIQKLMYGDFYLSYK